MGCASFKYYEDHVAEVKRVFVKKEFRGKGISIKLMDELEHKAKTNGYKKLILETGAPLVEARGLYVKMNYKIIENYGQYKDMPESICMEKML